MRALLILSVAVHTSPNILIRFFLRRGKLLFTSVCRHVPVSNQGLGSGKDYCKRLSEIVCKTVDVGIAEFHLLHTLGVPQGIINCLYVYPTGRTSSGLSREKAFYYLLLIGKNLSRNLYLSSNSR